jgi:hypothetical protein
MEPRPAEVCLDPQRRVEIRARGLNGIDYLEVSDDQMTLTVSCLRRIPENLTKEHVLIEGGVRIRDIKVLDLRFCSADDPEEEDCFKVIVDKAGDFSTYTVKLVETDALGNPTAAPLAGFDSRYAQLDFSFKAGLPSDLDCAQPPTSVAPAGSAPDINYLAKDYASFRQLILDRLALLMPGWQEQHVPDVGIALVEILAYAADHLSYHQDAVATEAYLNTARRRISVRRHVRLLDYQMHDGCNARTWIHVEAGEDIRDSTLVSTQLVFLAGLNARPGSGTVLSMEDLAGISTSEYEVFGLVGSGRVEFHKAHNEIAFYTWGDTRCCLPRGSTSATLKDHWEQAPPSPKPQPEGYSKKPKIATARAGSDEYSDPSPYAHEDKAPRARRLHVRSGDYLLFEEVRGPQTGSPADADASHRHVVKVTHVEAGTDPLNGEPIVGVAWDVADALPFEMCLSSLGAAPDCQIVDKVSVARGNILLVDHGRWVNDEHVGAAPLETIRATCEGEHRASDTTVVAGRFYPPLRVGHLTFREQMSIGSPASIALTQDPRAALPEIELRSIAPLPDGSGPVFSIDEMEHPERLAARLAAAHENDRGKGPSAVNDAAVMATLYLLERLSRDTVNLLAHFDPHTAMPPELALALRAEIKRFMRSWSPRATLVNSGALHLHFVVEVDDDGIGHLRFGDGQSGRAPEAGESFVASYRVGNGVEGNIAAGAIQHVAVANGVLRGVTLKPINKMPGCGGRAPESIDEAKAFAPGAFLNQLERAITADDYARLAERHPKVQRAAAALVWTGNRYEVRVAVDLLGTDAPDETPLHEVLHDLYRYRRIGHDLSVVRAQYVPLTLSMNVQVESDYLRAHVKRALLDTFSNGVLANGTRGVFHPDNLTFGQSVYVSPLVAAAQAVSGVQAVTITKLHRLFEAPQNELHNGVLTIGAMEVAQLDNDPVFPERGTLHLHVRGGR